ncbi:hypothetical protein H2199_008993 [Coniosporium tulheliwenetii]|uniref:Uncharacterized protein n=1 Tax=Coniosporium tulheliwenetii TaxID=3383036 RepID=A0ACC2YGP5_9PEZI|nr:hypothetical protein H2199_008993 [Cladosporium sp. JES 115]
MPTRSGAQYSQNQRRSWPNMAQPQRHPSPLAAAAAAAAAPAPPQRATVIVIVIVIVILLHTHIAIAIANSSPSAFARSSLRPELDCFTTSELFLRLAFASKLSRSLRLVSAHRSPPIWLIYCVTLALIIASAILIISPSPFPTYDCAPQCAATAEPIVNSERFPLSDCGYGPSNFSFLAYPNPYFGLGFTQERLNVKEERIKKRHRKLVGLWHPDKVQVTGLSVWQHERISEWLNTMYNDLMDTEKRVRYHQGTYEWGSQLKEDPSAPRRPAWYKEEYDRPDEEEES